MIFRDRFCGPSEYFVVTFNVSAIDVVTNEWDTTMNSFIIFASTS